MDNLPPVNMQKSFFLKKRNALIAIILLPLILTTVFVVMYFYFAETFKPEPKVEVQAQNTFEKTLHVVTDMNYAPYSYIDKNGEYSGLDVEMINEIANRIQMNLDLKLLDWNEANKVFANGDAEVIMNMESDSIISNKDIIATLPTTEKQYVVYGRREVKSVAELYGRRVASLHRMPGLGLDDEVTYLNSYDAIFSELKSGEIEFAICPIQVGNDFLEKWDIKDVYPSYAVTHVYGTLAMHPEDTMLRVKINAVLIQMQQEGRLVELHDKWISQHYENMTVTEMVTNRPWLVSVIVFSFILVLLLIVYIILEYRNAQTREAYTQRLQANFETINNQQIQLKSQQKELIEAKNRAEENSRAKTTFLFNMSHDIRTPMNAIIGYIELAKKLSRICDKCPRYECCEDNIPQRNYDFLKKVEAASLHLLALINDILEMGRIESGRMELEPVESNLVTVFSDIADMFEKQMQSKNIEFFVDTVSVKNPYVICDKNRLNRVLLNFLSNAYKFTPKDGKISLTLLQTDLKDNRADFEIHVKDSGIGMSEEFAKEIFEPFTRERTSTVSGIQGTGLGMAITKNIIDLMNGKIKVITAPNKGTEFVVNLSFEMYDAPLEETISDKDEENSKEVNFNQKHILLVDDIDVNREIGKMLLEEMGFIIDTAVDGKDALDKFSASKPGDYDLILMDVQMPVMNGYEATRMIRALENPALANIPIIAMTANAFSEDVQNAKAAGMNGHIAKPIDIAQLTETLTKIFQG